MSLAIFIHFRIEVDQLNPKIVRLLNRVNQRRIIVIADTIDPSRHWPHLHQTFGGRLKYLHSPFAGEPRLKFIR